MGVYKNGRVEIIANDLGNRITPSYVAFTDTDRLIGDAAKNQATTNPGRTIYDVKRLIGRQCAAAALSLANSQATVHNSTLGLQPSNTCTAAAHASPCGS